jgi:ankyrin repeat protein
MRHPRFGRTILHDVAGLNGIAGLAAVLLDAGARMDVRDDVLRSTPLGWACRWGRVEMARVLLERGADPEEADAEEWARPRAWAGKGGYPALLEALAGGTVRRPDA